MGNDTSSNIQSIEQKVIIQNLNRSTEQMKNNGENQSMEDRKVVTHNHRCYFFFNLFVCLFQRIKRAIYNRFIFRFLQHDKVGELRAEGGPPETASPLSSFNKFRGSIAWTEGFEKNLHILAKDQYPERSMAVFTSGGDAQGIYLFNIILIYKYIILGMNPAVRAIVRMGIYLGCKVYFIHEVCR